MTTTPTTETLDVGGVHFETTVDDGDGDTTASLFIAGVLVVAVKAIAASVPTISHAHLRQALWQTTLHTMAQAEDRGDLTAARIGALINAGEGWISDPEKRIIVMLTMAREAGVVDPNEITVRTLADVGGDGVNGFISPRQGKS